MRIVLSVFIILSFRLTLSSFDQIVKNIVFDFENGSFSDLSTNCANGYYLSQEIRTIQTLNVSFPKRGLYAYYVANGYGCLETDFLYLDDQSVLELEYYIFGDLARIKIQVIVQKNEWHLKKKVLTPESANKWNVLQTKLNINNSNQKYKVRRRNIYNYN